MSDDAKKDSGAAAAVSEPGSAPGTTRRDSQTTRRSTGLKLVTLAPAEGHEDGASGASSAQGAAQDALIGQIVDNRYVVDRVLGEGGMGVVYEARHTKIDKRFAMKVLRADLARDQHVTERFLIEAKAASAIGSEHIISISDFGELPGGATFFVMEFLDGQPLANLLEGEQPVPIERLINIARQLAEGLLAAHAAGIVHRDLKPDNIYLVPRRGDPDFVKILDFGIAKVSTGATGKLTRAGEVFGTPHYMSPEQASGAVVDHRGDIYSFGVILYEMASGRPPFDAESFMGILSQHMYKAPVPLRALVPPPQDIPPGLEAVILKCMSKRPEDRYPDMKLLIEDLDRLLSGTAPLAVREMMERSGGFNVPPDYFDNAGRTKSEDAPRKRKWPVVAGFAALGTVAAIAAMLFARGTEATPPPEAVAEKPSMVAPEPSPPAPVVEPVDEADLVITTQVVVGVQPIDARVFRGDEDLGTSPVVIQVPEGESIDLRVQREGYESKDITLDGKQKKVTVTLDQIKKTAVAPVRRSPPRRTATSKEGAPQPKPKVGGGEIVNPWQ